MTRDDVSFVAGVLAMHATRGIALVALLAAPSAADAQVAHARPAAVDTARVVFVCEHGAVKSMIAAALFNRLAMERGLAARAISRGMEPDSVVPALVRDRLRADGADLADARPTALGAADTDGARLIVAFDVDIVATIAGRVPVQRWDGTPSVMRDYDVGRDAILARVQALVEELKRAPPTRRTPRP